MERSSRWILLVLALGFLAYSLKGVIFPEPALVASAPMEGKVWATPPKGPDGKVPPMPSEHCDLWTPEFHARFTSRDASLVYFGLLGAKYRKADGAINLTTVYEHPEYQALRFQWQTAGVPPVKAERQQLPADLVPYRLVEASGKVCRFRFDGDGVAIEKSIRVGERPYELVTTARIENRGGVAKTHVLSVQGSDWRYTHEVKGSMFSQSHFITTVSCIAGDGHASRLTPADFEPADFANRESFPQTAENDGTWHSFAGGTPVAAVTNSYFAQALVSLKGPNVPQCQMQVLTLGNGESKGSGDFYRSRLTYPPKELKVGESAEYELLSFHGPKERALLATAAGGAHHFTELVDLGFFSVIAKLIVAFLGHLHGYIPSWGLTIIALTVIFRTLLFPMSIPSIQSAIKMRELKPEIDALNEKFKDDPQAKGLAQMELWKKHKVNPVKGCLPQLASMPVWFALYATLQTSVELFNVPFLWFPDLSAPDPLYILPFVIGGTTFLQQKLLPMSGGDPAQQKMMLYFMPAMMTVFMLFLPAGLGVYMFTSGLLGFLQQAIVQARLTRVPSAPASIRP